MAPSGFESVAALLAEVGNTILLPASASCSSLSTSTKADGTLVTAADLAAQRCIVGQLTAWHRDAAILAEEDMAGMPSPRWHDGELWVVDPLDGSAELARGGTRFGIILARVLHGRVAEAWLYLPVAGRLIAGSREEGYVDRCDPRPEPLPAKPAGTIKVGMRGDDAAVRALGLAFGSASLEIDPPSSCQDYADLLSGAVELALYAAPQSWDHLAGLFLHRLRGGRSRFYRRGSGVAVLAVATTDMLLDRAAEALDLRPDPGPLWFGLLGS